jgi:hypothetical protein
MKKTLVILPKIEKYSEIINDLPDEILLENSSYVIKDNGQLNRWYLHGRVADELGYDLGYILNFDVSNAEDGMYPVRVIGYHHPCTAFFWHIGRDITGLIVDDADDASRIQALKYQAIGMIII